MGIGPTQVVSDQTRIGICAPTELAKFLIFPRATYCLFVLLIKCIAGVNLKPELQPYDIRHTWMNYEDLTVKYCEVTINYGK